jgi:hypothetical protein
MSMPSEDTRRVLKGFGVAVTEYEEAVRNKSSADVVRTSEAAVLARLQEVTALIEQLRAAGSASMK